MILTTMQGTLRIYDGTATPYYFTLSDKGNLVAPMGQPELEEILKLCRGKMDSYGHYINGPYDKVMEALEVTFGFPVEDTTVTTYLLDWLEGNTVNSNPIATTKGSTQRVSGIDNPAFRDSGKKCCNVELMMDGATNIVLHYNEVYFPMSEASLQEMAEGNEISFKGKWYGTFVRDAAFTDGTDVTA